MARPYIPVDIERTIRLQARYRCGYCLSPQHLVMARLEIEHIIPLSKGGSSSIDNLGSPAQFAIDTSRIR